ncbi:MAG: hypothetical protein FH749_14010 [Firmicutes bacterium]|nr:hypothetical protein [Bacillota bacterium]
MQIVTRDMSSIEYERGIDNEIWDHAMDVNAWLCYRDEQLRYHGVKNNRFVYHTALPEPAEFDSYADLHIAHIASSSFTPERVKNGSQVIASEGAIASVFYHIYESELFKNQYCSDEFYQLFGTAAGQVNPTQNLYLKIFHALAQTDLTSSTAFLEFINNYGQCFPEEREGIIKLFLELTHYTTVSGRAAAVFGNLYRIGRRGRMEEFKQAYLEARSFKDAMLKEVLAGERNLDQAVHSEEWVQSEKLIPPVPWEDTMIPYAFDMNAATEVDLLALEGMTLEKARAMIKERQ